MSDALEDVEGSVSIYMKKNHLQTSGWWKPPLLSEGKRRILILRPLHSSLEEDAQHVRCFPDGAILGAHAATGNGARPGSNIIFWPEIVGQRCVPFFKAKYRIRRQGERQTKAKVGRQHPRVDKKAIFRDTLSRNIMGQAVVQLIQVAPQRLRWQLRALSKVTQGLIHLVK
ncbi:hypothetical protein PoB_006439500 [Plakobranchus ocellatus]|uniref:Uncharacterized protein n=1 Tax=Plakobranchus ocellatus TaxID=259542 RepID=A0AAV4D1I9_9GAST|nr:hypothetical protein PoB_006439500 [Plakobranchus ocellatus]